ncbi:ABC transporter ATP-binding protein [Pseudothermotoga sp. U03pept]|uniref:ABC transporter ATP-binding protein n=1 Tax=Pseudothermotoga sp. U03pept TaxID=3447012 RepID=UPI003F0AB53B
MELLRVEGVTKSFGGLVAVNNITFEVRANEILGIIGPNGAGKTTLTSLVAGTLQPSSGKIFFDGKDITEVPAHTKAKLGISRTFQTVRPLRDFTALENLVVGALFAKGEKLGKAVESAKEICEFLNFGRKDLYPDKLTVFELKKLEIARAVVSNPRILFLDEVMAGLNHEEMKEMIKIVKIMRDRGMTICVIEHVMSVISELTDRVIVLDRGEIIAQGPYQVVSQNKRVITAYLGEED